MPFSRGRKGLRSRLPTRRKKDAVSIKNGLVLIQLRGWNGRCRHRHKQQKQPSDLSHGRDVSSIT